MLTVPDIIVTNQNDANTILRAPDLHASVQYAISIGGRGQRLPSGFRRFHRAKIRLEFDDVEIDRPRFGYFGCTRDDIRTLVGFCERIAREPGPTLIHCAAGVSRSSAAAYALLNVLLGPGQEAEAHDLLEQAIISCFDRGLRTDDPIRPNRRLVWWSDQLLKRDGAMLRETETRYANYYRTPLDTTQVS